MRSTFRTLLLTALALASGCTAIVDPKGYQYDFGCDFRMDLTGMSAHTSQATHFYVDTPTVFTRDGVNLTLHAFMDPTPAVDFSIRLPQGVASHQSVLDFYSDLNDNGQYDHAVSSTNPNGDHAWVRSGLCGSAPLQFAHVFEFQDFDIPAGRPDPAQIHFVGFPPGVGPVEIRIFDESIGLTRGLYRRATTGNGTFDVTLDGIVDGSSDLDLEVEVWVDGNGNGTVDPGLLTDFAFTKSSPSNELGGQNGLTLTFGVAGGGLGTVKPYGGSGPYVTVQP